MKKFLTFVAIAVIFPFLSATAAPKFTSCISKDSMVKVDLTSQEGESEMIDLKISSNNPDRPMESTFPTRESINETQITYSLLDSEFSLLIVDLATGEGKLSNGQFLSPHPFIEVVCQ